MLTRVVPERGDCAGCNDDNLPMVGCSAAPFKLLILVVV